MISHTPIGRRGVPQVSNVIQYESVLTRIKKALEEHHLFRDFTIFDTFNIPKAKLPLIIMERQEDYLDDERIGNAVTLQYWDDFGDKARGNLENIKNVLEDTPYSNVNVFAYDGPTESVANLLHGNEKIPNAFLQEITIYAN